MNTVFSPELLIVISTPEVAVGHHYYLICHKSIRDYRKGGLNIFAVFPELGKTECYLRTICPDFKKQNHLI